jgi:hypothetical protein
MYGAMESCLLPVYPLVFAQHGAWAKRAPKALSRGGKGRPSYSSCLLYCLLPPFGCPPCCFAGARRSPVLSGLPVCELLAAAHPAAHSPFSSTHQPTAQAFPGLSVLFDVMHSRPADRLDDVQARFGAGSRHRHQNSGTGFPGTALSGTGTSTVYGERPETARGRTVCHLGGWGDG